jgi:hypothetical protein
MLTKRRFHALIVLLSILSFLAPVKFQGYTASAAEHFLINGTLTTVFYTISLVFGPIGMLIAEPGRIADPQQLISALFISGMAIASLLYNYAVLGLLVWNLFFLVVHSRSWRMLYRIGLLFSFLSSILCRLIPPFSYGSGLGLWLPLILLLIAIAGEFWLGSRKKKSPRDRTLSPQGIDQRVQR